MEEIMEQYGGAILQILGGMSAMALAREMFVQGGILQQIAMQYFVGLCG